MSLCKRCGKCCWDWKGNNPADKCEHLGGDLKTCLIYGRRAEYNRPECDNPMSLHQAVDLPPECGYVLAWKERGLV